jgi:chondroitin-sulfate-ABC endolyase/exolyase
MKTILRIKVNSFCFLLFACLFNITTVAQNQNLETTLPANWSVTNGSISISNNHSKAGAESLQWDWNAGSIITIDNPSVISAQVLDFYYNTFKMWVHNEVAATDTFTVQFFSSTGAVVYWFKFINNYEGWQQTIRSYLNSDMHRVGNVTSFSKVLLRAPTTGSGGTLYIDNIDWVITREGRIATPSQPDITGYLSDFGSFLASSNWTKDVVVSTPTATDITEMNTIYTRVINSISTSAPSAAAVTSAQTSYATYNIVRTGNQIKGKPLTNADLSPIDGFILTLARAYYHSNDLVSRDMALDLIEHLIDQGFSYGSNVRGGFTGSSGYGSRNIGRAILLMQNAYTPSVKDKVYKMLQWQYDLYDLWNPSGGHTSNTDDIYLAWQVYTAAFNFAPTDSLKKQHLKGYQRWMNRILTPSKAQGDFFKTDFLGFHHNTHHTAYMYVVSSIEATLGYLDQTDFQVSPGSYRLLRNTMTAMLIMSNKLNYANSHCGRGPLGGNIPFGNSNVLRLISIGGHILGTGNRDDSLAAVYNRVWGAGANPLLTPIAPENATGFYQFNYGPFGIYRNSNYVVTLKGMNKDFWGAEIYSTANRYGRYQSYGTIEVMYDGPQATASGMNVNGYNWNHPPGTTTIRMPDARLAASNGREDQYTPKRFSGTLAFGNLFTPSNMLDTLYGSSGIFAMDFQQSAHSVNHSTSFVFKKSVFAHNGMLVALGSNISNNNAIDSTVTTLFQNILQATGNSININGANETAFPYNETLAASSNNWLLNSYNTGYFVPGNNDEIVVTKQNNISPSQSGNGTTTTGNISYAFINHNTAPNNRGYEFVVMPNTNATAMTNFATAMGSVSTQPYTVLQKDSMAHIVKFNADSVYGYALFKANNDLPANSGLVKSNTTPVMVMTKTICDSVYLSLTNPDLNFTTVAGQLQSTAVPVDLVLNGMWNIAVTHPRASVTASTTTSTTIQFITFDGLPINIVLVRNRVPSVITATAVKKAVSNPCTLQYVDSSSVDMVYLEIDPNGNAFNPDSVIVTRTAAKHINVAGATYASLMNYFVHIAAPGTYTVNGGVKVKIYYDSVLYKDVSDDYPNAVTWKKHEGNTTSFIEAFAADANLAQTSPATNNVIPSATGTSSNGIKWVEFTVSSFSTFGLYNTGLNAPLPVTILYFTVQKDKDYAILNWAVNGEESNKKFAIEHSTNGISFAEIGTVTGKPTTGRDEQYRYVHREAVSGRNYYRVKVKMAAEKEAYTNIQSVYFGKANDMWVYPNPFIGNTVKLHIATGKAQKIIINLFTPDGKLVRSYNHKLQVGENTISLENLGHLDNGTYILKVNFDDKTVNNIKLMKE